ncbi:MAG: hypothetical protein C3L25_13760 [Candidatus Sedimenticola endophacoides]|nr:MAG: hypothetical protein C3L26_13855 [Candidatus Sedimenticola endophacoides]PUE00433.1 MAG: hypothetical protein C3L25_13760 [Candidatus Sedimenticola endophacoides]
MGKERINLRQNRIFIAGVMACAALLLSFTNATGRIEWLLHDLHSRILSEPDPGQVAIVEIDDASLQSHGRWPWPRALQARLIERISEAPNRGLGLYLVHTEPSPPADAEDDQRLAAALRAQGRTVLPVMHDFDQMGGRQELLPIAPLDQTATALGHATIELDPDMCCLRDLFLYAGLHSPRWPALPLALIAQNPPTQWRSPMPDTLPRTGHRNYDDGWNQRYPIRPRFATDPRQIPRVSARRRLAGDADALRILEDKYILLGVTATGVSEQLVTPHSGGYSRLHMVENAAMITNALLLGHWSTQAPALPSALLAALLTFLGTLLILRAAHFRLWHLALVLLGLPLAWLLAILTLRLWLPLGPVMTTLGASLLISRWCHLRDLNTHVFQDHLTGLHNRRSFDNQLRLAWDACRQSGKPLALILVQECRYLVKDFGTSQSPKSTRQRDSRYCPDRPALITTPSRTLQQSCSCATPS